MKKIVLFGLPLIALTFAVACKKQEAAAPVTEAPAAVAGTAVEATPAVTPAAAPAATPAPAAAPKAEKKTK